MIECQFCQSPGRETSLSYDHGRSRRGIQYECGRKLITAEYDGNPHGGPTTNSERIAFLNMCVYTLKTACEVIAKQDKIWFATGTAKFALLTYDKR